MSVIDKNGRYVGGAILPGLRVSLDSSMSASTAQLPRISLDTPRRVIGKNTIDCMRSGVIFGNAAMIDGMLDRIEEELGEKTSIIATGGISKIVLPLCSHTITYDGALLMKDYYIYMKKQENRIIKRLSLGRCIYMIHSDGRQPFITVYYTDIYSLPVTVTAAFILQPSASYSLSQSDPASRRPDGVQIQTDLPRFHSRNPDIFSDRGSLDFHCSKLVFTVKFAKFY